MIDVFLNEVKNHLNDGGIVQLIQSSLSGNEETLEKLDKLGFIAEIAEKEHFFFEDFSQEIIYDETLPRLISMPNVIITSHQAFLTNEALESIAKVTLQNLKDFFDNKKLSNEISYN